MGGGSTCERERDRIRGRDRDETSEYWTFVLCISLALFGEGSLSQNAFVKLTLGKPMENRQKPCGIARHKGDEGEREGERGMERQTDRQQ